jgi:hypothetical protein
VPQHWLEITGIERANAHHLSRPNRFDAKTTLVFGAIERHCIRFYQSEVNIIDIRRIEKCALYFLEHHGQEHCCNYQTN